MYPWLKTYNIIVKKQAEQTTASKKDTGGVSSSSGGSSTSTVSVVIKLNWMKREEVEIVISALEKKRRG